jgi:hypothetical protein
MSRLSPRLTIPTPFLPLVLLAAAAPVHGQAPPDQRVWTSVAAQGRFGAESSWRWAADGLVRTRDGARTMDSLAARVVVNRGVTPTSEAGVGYAYSTSFLEAGGTRREHRFHQQVAWRPRRAGGRLALRSRIEERLIDGNPDMQWRMRQQVRVAWSLGGTKRLQVVASDEVFVNITAAAGASRGFGGNRAFAGVRRAVTPQTAVEVGYLHLYTPNRAGPGRHSHVITTALALSF